MWDIVGTMKQENVCFYIPSIFIGATLFMQLRPWQWNIPTNNNWNDEQHGPVITAVISSDRNNTFFLPWMLREVPQVFH